ncbi:MAG: branched-chain amino acid ABC transporter permease [Alphaproteobacteria bacterium]|nr:branched-chain amino acid ABC transporter permease [Alphaproteobacteria bacterium]
MLSLLWSGVVTGCLYALGALGLVLIFKSSKVVNFSHGSLAGVSAFIVYASSSSLPGLPWAACVALALLAAVAIATLTYVVIAPVVFESDLTATVATLGVSLVLQGVVLIVFGSDIVSLELPLPRWSMTVAGLRVSAYDLAVLGATAAAIALLFLVIERTRLGIAFRAVSASPFAARVCGLSIRSVHLFSWILAALLGVLAALLIVPTTFLSPTTVASFMLQAFAAAVLGGFESLPGAAVGGIVVGILVNLFTFYVSPEFTNSFLLVLILTALGLFPGGILSRRGGSRV